MSGFSGIDQSAWTAYTPTITAQTGTPTTVTATGRYKQIGKTVLLNITVAISNIGTAGSNLIASLPLTAAVLNFTGSSAEVAATAKSGGAAINTNSQTTVFCRDAATASYWVNGYTVVIGIIYEIP